MTSQAISPAAPPVRVSSAPGWPASGRLTQIGVLAGRSLRAFVNNRRLLLFELVQPLILLLIMSQVFGSMSNPKNFPAGVAYIDYLLPGILITTATGTATGAGYSLLFDMENGVLSRFRSMPIRMSSVLVARSLDYLVRVAAQLAVLLATALLLLDCHPRGGALGLGVAVLLTLFVTWAVVWGFLALGSWLRNKEVVAGIGPLAMFPLTFASSAFVPVHVLPDWLRFVAKANPLTYVVDAARRVALGWPLGDSLYAAVGATLALLLVVVFLAVRGFDRTPSDR
ncbi:ABC transporter permease [Streptomyces varsoviensis]|uniref:ABC transporter permease n=1 Tax=Streptomyces varsoviensis TaxID=67373 RepID=UPI0004C69710|nr:ABC transporter permease [Streptomyces varsoviensis]